MNASPVCKIITCNNPIPDDGTICESCWRQIRGDVHWLAVHVPDLAYRANPAYGKSGERGGGGGRSPDPVRANAHELLWETDDWGNDCIDTASAMWMRCMGIHYRSEWTLHRRLTLLDSRMDDHVREHSSTPVYGAQVMLLARKGRRILDAPHEEQMTLGECPNPDCDNELSCGVEATECRCTACGNTFTVSFLRMLQRERLLRVDTTGTQKECVAMLRQAGIIVNLNTLRSWVFNGDVRPVGRDGRRKLYRLADIYERATRSAYPAGSVWQLLSQSNQDNN